MKKTKLLTELKRQCMNKRSELTMRCGGNNPKLNDSFGWTLVGEYQELCYIIELIESME